MQRAVFSVQVVLSKTTCVDNTLGKSINLLKCVCHASLSFIDPFNNPIIKLMCYVLKTHILVYSTSLDKGLGTRKPIEWQRLNS